MKKKFLSLLLCTSLVSTLLVGCGSKPSDEQSSPTAESSSEYTKADGKIVYWSMWDTGSNQANAIQEIVKEYEKKSGNKVDLQFKGREIKTIIGSALQAGQEIDLYEGDADDLSITNKDYAADLEEMAQKANYYEKSNVALTDKVKENAGFLACLPYQPFISGFFYDKDMFEKAGIKEEPKTWNEFLEVCEKLKQSGVNPITIDGQNVNMTFGTHLARYIGQDAVENLSLNGGWADEPAVKKAAQDMLNLYEKGYFSPYAPASFPQGQNEIGYGESAMIYLASWLPDEVKANTGRDVNWGMFSYPAVEGGVDGTNVMMMGSQGISISNKSKNKQAAFELALEIVTGKGDEKISLEATSVPADPNTAEWPKALENCKPAYLQATDTYSWGALIEKNSDFVPGLTDALSKLLQGNLTADQFVAQLDKINPKK